MTVVPRFVLGAAALFALAGPAFAQTTLKYQFKDGEVKDVKIPSETVKAMRDVPGAGKGTETWTEEGLARLLKESGLALPGGAMDKGAEWKNKMQGMTPFGKIAGEVAYKYEGSAD